ncbi:zinc finger protein castor homolog 1-like isoform X2 [Atheta coriaria]|uniref:zinc finger protein castor homolog 1-like isoform X2 n=1 Tax=Dalotia coriaria TaxID=877792 RepID=UPI0031F45164
MEENHKHLMNSRGIFPHLLNYSSMKSEDGSPPPSFDTTSPLNAIMAQTFNAQRDSQSLLTKSQTQIDYSKYVKKFSSSMECGSPYCKELNYREHFHCLDCNSRVFLKKEEMIRHFKWHKKRDESLQHGFMRYSPLDDCSDRYGNCCTHNKKQTHYHCIKEGCDKVYISTSDVQMHANYHRKDSAIIQEGFQRFRATEECGAAYCAFFGQRTTHFHCRRSNCRYTFKNKSDMEKHKTYHIKDEQLSRDGFKKFMKNEACPYESCRFSKVCNHIHCIRPQCNYVLHSSGQLFSHKRKHERKDSELAYRKYKLAQSMMKSLSDAGSTSFPSDFDAVNMNAFAMGMGSNTSESLSERNSPISYDEDNSAMDLTAGESNFDEASLNWATHSEEIWRKYCQLYSGNENCGCEYVNTEHYHCNGELCEMTFSSKEAAREHARQHDQQEQVTEMFFTLTCEDPTTCPYQAKDKHYHCTLEHCREVILPQDKTFRRLEHYKMHEYSKKLSLTKDPLTMTHLTTSIDGMFARKRGRPPKNRVIEVWNNDYQNTGQNIMDSPQAIFTSFKLPKPSSTSTPTMNNKEDDSDERSTSPKSPKSGFIDGVNLQVQGFDVFPENSKCPDMMCPYMGSMHYHCVQNRCMYVTDKEETLVTHSKDFHDNPDILEGYEFFEKGTDCRLASCQHKMERHFHCTRGDCNYTFVKYSTLSLHSLVHQPWDMQQQEQNLKQQFKNEAEDMVTTSNIVRDDRDKTQEKVSDSNDISGSNTLYGPESSCSRPFCKLKRKFHYHCNACNQAFSEIDRLVVHVAKHSTGVLSGQTFHAEDNNNRNVTPSPPPTASKSPKIQVAPLQSLQNPTTPQIKEEPSNGGYLQQQFEAYQHFGNFPANLQFALMQQQQFLPQSYAAAAALSSQQLMFQHQAMMQNPLYGDNMSPLAAMAANLNKRALEGAQDMSPEAKKARIQSSMRILKDEPVPEGYLRFRFNEDCQYQHCGYREHQTHFHCQRMDCGYSFCDKTRFVQHTARHERLDTLMGGDFQQYRANVSCGRPDCAYTAHLGSTQNKASHFHCLKCDFVCTDTNKVVAHRRQHQKLDSIQAAGFEKFTPSQQCRSTTCQHSGKQTHYHCLQCQYAVLGLAQMSAHKYRHMEG